MVKLLESDFKAFRDPELYQFKKHSTVHPYLDGDSKLGDTETELSERTSIYRLNIDSDLWLEIPHDFKKDKTKTSEFEEWSLELEKFKEKMDRRADRLFSYGYKRFYRYVSKPRQLSVDIVKILLSFCDELVIITPYPKELLIGLTELDKVRVIEDKYVSLHQSWKKEGLRCYFDST